MYRFLKWLTLLAIAGGIFLIVGFWYLYKEVRLEANELIHYAPQVSTEILDRNGKRLAYIFDKQHRLYAKYDEIPGFLIEGLVAMEDTLFFEHNGVNPDAIIRAIIKDIKARAFVEGGSTITQQLVKNKLLTREKTLVRKLKEAILAIKIEKELTKEQILERYLNEISYGNNYYGVKTAAQGYFHKDLNQLTLKESAILVGIPNAPSFYNPIRHYERVLNRANSVLYRMKQLGWITQEQYLQAVKETPKVYKTSLSQNIAPYVVDEVKRRFSNKISDFKTGGYKVYTTIDIHLQNAGKKTLAMHQKKLKNQYDKEKKHSDINGALVAVDHKKGDILALVGGVSYKHSSYNRAVQSNRQPGSAFKPFIYQTALDMGYNPATPLTDIRRTFAYNDGGVQKVWSPRNYERNFKGFITLREALVHSRNLATVNLVHDIGIDTIKKRLRFLDIPHVPNDLSLALGNLGVSPLKMAQIYTVFSNSGHMIAPRLVSKIISKEGTIVYETRPKEITDFTMPEQAYLMTDILRDVIQRGTGRKAAIEGIELAGKTGTTNRGVDTWFCGYSPEITAVVWFGRDRNIPIGKGATGGSVAAPAFKDFFERFLALYPKTPRKFQIPKGVYVGTINGKKELYTDISPLPGMIEETKPQENEMYEMLLDQSNKNRPKPPAESQQSSDKEPLGLHPPRIKPREPASDDSGMLF